MGQFIYRKILLGDDSVNFMEGIPMLNGIRLKAVKAIGVALIIIAFVLFGMGGVLPMVVAVAAFLCGAVLLTLRPTYIPF